MIDAASRARLSPALPSAWYVCEAFDFRRAAKKGVLLELITLLFPESRATTMKKTTD